MGSTQSLQRNFLVPIQQWLPDFGSRFSSSAPASIPASTPVSQETQSEASQVHILECSGSSSSFCNNHHCTLQCSDGTKVELECPSNSLAIQQNAVGGAASMVQVSCGSEDQARLPACFPFCF